MAAGQELTIQAANLLAHIASNSEVLSSINIRAPQNIIIEMIPHLSHAPSLQTVNLSNNNLEGYAFTIVERLSHAPSIQSISLNRTSLTAGETAAIIELINVHNQEVQNYNTDLVSLLKTEIKDHEGSLIPTEIATLMGDYLPDNIINVDIV